MVHYVKKMEVGMGAILGFFTDSRANLDFDNIEIQKLS